jgi:hypothetical protein
MSSILSQDINRKINNSFLYVEADGYKGVAECGEFILADDDTPVLFANCLFSNKRLELFDPSISYKIPRLGYVNVVNSMTALYLELSTRQQWQKGFNLGALSVVSPWNRDMQETTRVFWKWERVIPKRDLALSVFDRKFYSFNEACSLLFSGEKVSCALDNSVALSIPASGEEDRLDIYYRLYKVGEYDANKGKYELSKQFSPFLSTSIEEVLHASG